MGTVNSSYYKKYYTFEDILDKKLVKAVISKEFMAKITQMLRDRLHEQNDITILCKCITSTKNKVVKMFYNYCILVITSCFKDRSNFIIAKRTYKAIKRYHIACYNEYLNIDMSDFIKSSASEIVHDLETRRLDLYKDVDDLRNILQDVDRFRGIEKIIRNHDITIQEVEDLKVDLLDLVIKEKLLSACLLYAAIGD